jgi:hypothetical protein
VYLKEHREYQIMKFLKENGPSKFGLISKHLEKKGVAYKKTKGLANKLNTLVNQHKIKKDREQKPYPVYSYVEDQALDFAIAGEQFCDDVMPMPLGYGNMDENYWKNDVELHPEDSYETKFIKIMITRYGFYVFAALLKNLDYWIKKTDGSRLQINSRKIWLDHALDLPKMQEMIFNCFSSYLTEDRTKEDGIPKNKKLTKEKINKVKNSMRELYPKLYQLIDIYECRYEKDRGTINRLKNSPSYKETLEQIKF